MVAAAPPTLVVDLGTGGGVPGLILAARWPATRLLLLDGSVRRIKFVQGAIATLGLESRVEAVALRAEDAGRSYRGVADLVVCRGFGPPSVTAECAAGLIRRDGWVAVAEPPENRPERWPPDGLARLGLSAGPRVEEPAHIQLLRAQQPCPDRYPRRVGIPAKRPLWSEPPSSAAQTPDAGPD